MRLRGGEWSQVRGQCGQIFVSQGAKLTLKSAKTDALRGQLSLNWTIFIISIFTTAAANCFPCDNIKIGVASGQSGHTIGGCSCPVPSRPVLALCQFGLRLGPFVFAPGEKEKDEQTGWWRRKKLRGDKDTMGSGQRLKSAILVEIKDAKESTLPATPLWSDAGEGESKKEERREDT